MEDLIKAFTIFAKYSKAYAPTHCEHDILIVNVKPTDMLEADEEELKKLGFKADLENNWFYSYRFGSC